MGGPAPATVTTAPAAGLGDKVVTTQPAFAQAGPAPTTTTAAPAAGLGDKVVTTQPAFAQAGPAPATVTTAPAAGLGDKVHHPTSIRSSRPSSNHHHCRP